jgi:hypothetical protein
MVTQLETERNQAEINGALSLAFVMVLDILQVISPEISRDERFNVLKRVIKETPGRRPPGCRSSSVQVSAVQEVLSPNLFEEFNDFWNELLEDQP